MKKRFTLVLTCLIIICLITACAGMNSAIGGETAKDDKINIVCTTFSQYDWTKEVIKGREEQIRLVYLFQDGADLHSFQPTADDMIQVASADLLIFVGGENDGWLLDASKEATNPNQVKLSMLEFLEDELKEEELVEGMEGYEEGGQVLEVCSAGDGDAHSHEHDEEYDEHVWLSLSNAERITKEIASILSTLDPEGKDVYDSNAKRYCNELEELKSGYQTMLADCELDTILVGDRFPYLYLTEEFGIKYYAAFAGCSAESEASFETVTFLAGKLNELGIDTVLILENSDGEIAKTIIRNSENKNQEIAVLNSIQSVKADDVENGTTYLKIMEENRLVLGKALKAKNI